jgi:glyoxylase-like metal-dependent hydrolase (beta-lactamase superfamily II)
MASAIPYIREFDPDYGTLVRVSTNVRRLTARNPSPFSAWGTNVYIIGQNAVDLIDPGPDTDEHFNTLINVLGEEKIHRIFVTHHHLDHSPMANRLAAHFGCQTFGYGPPKQQLAPDGVQMEAGDDDAFIPAIKVQDGEVFEGDGWSLEAIHTPGHTSNHVCYAVQDDNGLICGDHVMAWSTSVISPPDGDMADYLASLHKVLDRQFSTLWPGHGAAITAPAPFIAAYIAHRHERNAQILEQLGQGQSQIKTMVPIMYADVDPRLYPAACHSVLAHMVHMVKTGTVTCADEPTVDSQYRLA